MEKKSIAATILVIMLALVFSVVGVCFSSFIASAKKIEVQTIKINSSNGIVVFVDEEKKQTANELKLSVLETGLKPATGEVDAETEIPTTVNDEGTTEGYYGSVFVESTADFWVTISNISIKGRKDASLIEKERKNIYITIKGVEKSTKTFEDNIVTLGKIQGSADLIEITVFVWLGALAGDDLEGAKINFDLNFIKV
ncbi:MAG: hypothetical protein IJ538_04290 [Clostridia bacterium]|nr:hypothetical protein [Clostridia bacterium]